MVIYYEPERSLEPPEEQSPICPVCESECWEYIQDWFGNVIGCDNCTERLDAWDELEDEDYDRGVKPSCPVCGYDCKEYVRNAHKEILGCDRCTDQIDAWDAMWQEEVWR